MTKLYERLLYLCKKMDITFYAIEKGSGLSRSTLRYWENAMPSGDKILKVANFLDVSVDYLLGNTDNLDSHKTGVVYDLTALEEIKDAFELQTKALSDIIKNKIDDIKQRNDGSCKEKLNEGSESDG